MTLERLLAFLIGVFIGSIIMQFIFYNTNQPLWVLYTKRVRNISLLFMNIIFITIADNILIKILDILFICLFVVIDIVYLDLIKEYHNTLDKENNG